jgi:hypothetical protein
MPIIPTASRDPVDEDEKRKEREKKAEKAQAAAVYKGVS